MLYTNNYLFIPTFIILHVSFENVDENYLKSNVELLFVIIFIAYL